MDMNKCKKCGCELPSDSKKKLCESCRKRRNEKIKMGLAITGSVLLTVLTLGAAADAINKHKK